VYRAVYAEVNARLQLQAMQLGEPQYLTEAEAHATMVNNETHVERPWALWKQAAQRALAEQQ
jgi:HCOMODA/2-hydroxy-3-carboxy-muconic semialdehyde decarboxylase